jgi:putative transposase
MPRGKRDLPDGVPQHIVNRGNRKGTIFRCDADYLGFVGAMTEAGERTVVRLMSFNLMPNHFHLVLWPYQGVEISTYMQVLMNVHLRDLLPRHSLRGLGHVYQGRYRNHLVHNDLHFLNVCRYVESNALRAGLVQRAELWPWCSLSCSGPEPGINLLAPWPVPKPRDWLDQVNATQKLRRPRAIWTPRERSISVVTGVSIE